MLQLETWSLINIKAGALSLPIQLRQGFDICHEPVLHDMCGTMGYLKAISLMLRVEVQGLATLAIPCNSFGYMASSQHQRSIDNPMGNPIFAFVNAGNMVCLRAIVLIALAIVRHVHYFVENPERSTLALHPFFMFLHASQMFGHQRSFW